jgi:hypothetical protein
VLGVLGATLVCVKKKKDMFRGVVEGFAKKNNFEDQVQI